MRRHHYVYEGYDTVPDSNEASNARIVGRSFIQKI